MKVRSLQRFVRAVVVIAAMVLMGTPSTSAQELIPAAYTPAPVGVNLLSVATYYNNGDIAFDPSGPSRTAAARSLSRP